MFYSGNIFATGGGDGNANIWDMNARKRIRQLGKYNNSISALAFSKDNKFLAISSSYCFERGACRYFVYDFKLDAKYRNAMEREVCVEIFNDNFL